MVSLVGKHQNILLIRKDRAILLSFKTATLFAVWSFMPTDGFADEVTPNEQLIPSTENNSLKNTQDFSVEPDLSTSSQLEHFEEEDSQEGIPDAFSQNQKDKFQKKKDKRVEFIPVK